MIIILESALVALVGVGGMAGLYLALVEIGR